MTPSQGYSGTEKMIGVRRFVRKYPDFSPLSTSGDWLCSQYLHHQRRYCDMDAKVIRYHLDGGWSYYCLRHARKYHDFTEVANS